MKSWHFDIYHSLLYNSYYHTPEHYTLDGQEYLSYSVGLWFYEKIIKL